MNSVKEKEIPLAPSPEDVYTLNMFTKNIIECTNFNFIKFGDGEFDCMLGKAGHNCDFHPNSKKLSKRLHDAYNILSQMLNTYIGDWRGEQYSGFKDKLNKKLELRPNTIFYELLLNQDGLLSKELFSFYKAIKESTRKKIFVGNEKLVGVNNFLDTDYHVIIPEINAFGSYSQIISKCKNYIGDNCIFIFAAGMPAKVMALDLLTENKNITCIDCGSAFDPIFFTKTRWGQAQTTDLQKFYENLLA